MCKIRRNSLRIPQSSWISCTADCHMLLKVISKCTVTPTRWDARHLNGYVWNLFRTCEVWLRMGVISDCASCTIGRSQLQRWSNPPSATALLFVTVISPQHASMNNWMNLQWTWQKLRPLAWVCYLANVAGAKTREGLTQSGSSSTR